jgi:hypothetical protein
MPHGTSSRTSPPAQPAPPPMDGAAGRGRSPAPAPRPRGLGLGIRVPPQAVADAEAAGPAPGDGQGRVRDLLATVVDRQQRDPLGRAATRALRQALGASASADARGAADDLRQVVQPVTTCRRVLVGAVRGGAGATTLAALLGCAYAKHRDDLVVAMDAGRGHGSLGFRLDGAAAWSSADLAALAGLADVQAAARLVRGRGRLSVLPRPPGVDLDRYWSKSAALTRFLGVAVVDGGHDALTVPGHLDGAHSLVLAVPATVDGVRSALAWLEDADDGLSRRTVPVLVARAPHHGLRPAAAVRALSAGGPAATWLRYDPVLATGAPLDLPRLAADTVGAVLHVAGAALTSAIGGRS